MVWRAIGSISAGDDWQTISRSLTSDVIRASFTGNFRAGRFPRGFLRLQWEADLFSADWVQLYPKGAVEEVYRLDFLLPIDAEFPKVQVRKRLYPANTIAINWAVSLSEWI